MSEKNIKKTVWLWAAIGLIVGGWLGIMVAGYIGGGAGAVIIGFMAYRSSAKNDGAPPSWLWRSKKKK